MPSGNEDLNVPPAGESKLPTVLFINNAPVQSSIKQTLETQLQSLPAQLFPDVHLMKNAASTISTKKLGIETLRTKPDPSVESGKFTNSVSNEKLTRHGSMQQNVYGNLQLNKGLASKRARDMSVRSEPFAGQQDEASSDTEARMKPLGAYAELSIKPTADHRTLALLEGHQKKFQSNLTSVLGRSRGSAVELRSQPKMVHDLSYKKGAMIQNAMMGK